MTHPNFRDVHIEIYGNPIYASSKVNIKFRWINNAGYDIETKPKWRRVPKKFMRELVPYNGK